MAVFVIFQVHKYVSESEKVAANEKCCGTERVSVALTCCNNAGYNPTTQVCADVSIMESGTMCQMHLVLEVCVRV